MRKIRKNFSRKKIFIIIGLAVILLGLLFLLFLPSIMEEKADKEFKREIKEIISKIDNGKKIDMSLYRKKYILSDDKKKVEKLVEEYLENIVNNTKKIKDVDIISKMLKDKVNEKFKNDLASVIENTAKEKELLAKEKENLKRIKDNKYKNIDKDIIKLYKKYISLDLEKKYIDIIDKRISNIDKELGLLKILNDNKDSFNIEKKEIEFLKRNRFNDFEKIVKELKYNIKYRLIEDKKSPEITAQDINIYTGTSLDIKSSVKCIDDVDDEVECKIEGNVDVNKENTYPVKISAVDKANNKSEKTINVIVKKKIDDKNPYYTEVIRNQNTVIVYGLDSNNEYTKIVKVFPCSVGRSGQDTPTGTFKTSDKYRWGGLYGGVWGQYSTRIVDDILFHSVPYYSENPGDLEWEEYNKLGSPASLGCVRMTVEGVKWIYDNCPKGMTVKIYDGNLPSGVSKPTAPKIDGTSPNKGWDPTDPDPNNPWK